MANTYMHTHHHKMFFIYQIQLVYMPLCICLLHTQCTSYNRYNTQVQFSTPGSLKHPKHKDIHLSLCLYTCAKSSLVYCDLLVAGASMCGISIFMYCQHIFGLPRTPGSSSRNLVSKVDSNMQLILCNIGQ